MKRTLTTLTLCAALSSAAGAQTQPPKYAITVLPPGGPAPRLADGHPGFTGPWVPNRAGQGGSGRFGVDPAAMRAFDPKVTPEARPGFYACALGKVKAMTP